MKQIYAAMFMALCFAISAAAGAASLQGSPVAARVPVQVIEYYHAGLDHYFITAEPREIANLDSAGEWTRTGFQFGAFSSASVGAGLTPVCRFYGRPEAGLDSHFYSGSTVECAAVYEKFASSWTLESDNVFSIQMPDVVTGTCPAAALPVYRIYNNRRDVNHRYTTDTSIRQAMLLKGGVPEGFGRDAVAFCAEANTESNAAAPISVSILTTQIAPDMFAFSTSVAAAIGSAIIAYTWDFSDGTTATGAAVSHRFQQPGVYNVFLSVADNKGQAGSALKSVTVAAPSNTGSTGSKTPSTIATSDFDRRKSLPGVIRWFDFDAHPSSWDNIGNEVRMTHQYLGNIRIDPDVKSSGGGSLRIDVPSLTDQTLTQSEFVAAFSDDRSVLAGAPNDPLTNPRFINADGYTEFFVQWRQRFNQAFVDTYFYEGGPSNPQEGIKQAIFTAGNKPGGGMYGSCEAIGVVLQTYYQHRLPMSYNSCTSDGVHVAYAGFEQAGGNGPDYFVRQNGAAPYCKSTDYNSSNTASGEPNCFAWHADEWMTFQVGITLGPRVRIPGSGSYFAHSRYRLWGAHENQPSRLLLDWREDMPDLSTARPGNDYFQLTAGTPTDDQYFGNVWLLAFMTNKDGRQVHPLARTWYDELIISTQRISDPTSASGPFPAWRKNKPVGQFFPIIGTESMSGYTWPEPNPTRTTAIIDAWNGLAQSGTRWWSAAASGHGEWQNPTLEIDLQADAPKWRVLDAGSAYSDAVTNAAYYKDGRPVSRHTYYTQQFIRGSMSRDGVDRVMLFTSSAAYGIGTGAGEFGGDGSIDGFRLSDNKWDAAGTWAKIPMWQRFMSVARDPRNDDVYVGGGYAIQKWAAKTGAWSQLLDHRIAPSLMSWDQYDPSLVDSKRNRLVALHDGAPYDLSHGMRLQTVDLATNALMDIGVTGMSPSTQQGSALIHDLDNDRYLNIQPTGNVYAIDPDTGTASLIVTVPKPTNTVESRTAYFPELGGVAYLPTYWSAILFMPTR